MVVKAEGLVKKFGKFNAVVLAQKKPKQEVLKW